MHECLHPDGGAFGTADVRVRTGCQPLLTSSSAAQVYLPDKAPWLQDFETEMMQFRNGKFDDQVDSVSQFLSWVDYRRSRRMYCVPIS